jgi:hypothetical protein
LESTCLLLLQVLASSACVSRKPNACTMKLVGSRTCQELNLAIAATQFGVNRRYNHSHFTDQIGGDESGCLRSCLYVSGGCTGATPSRCTLILSAERPANVPVTPSYVHAERQASARGSSRRCSLQSADR